MQPQTPQVPMVYDRSVKLTVLLATCLGNFLFPFNVFSLNLAVPVIGKEFAMNAFLLGWIGTGFLLASAVSQIPVGRLSDIYGRKKFWLIGISIIAITSVFLPFVTSAEMLITIRFIQGIGGAMYLVTQNAMLAGVYPKHELGFPMGITTTFAAIGVIGGTLIGGIFLSIPTLGWRALFMVNIPLAVLGVAVIMWKLKPEWAGAKGEKFDFRGLALYAPALIALTYGVTQLPSIMGWAFIIPGFLVLAVFGLVQRKTALPLINLAVFKNRYFNVSNIVHFLFMVSMVANAYMLNLYLQYGKGLTPLIASYYLLIIWVVGTIFGPLGGKLTDKYGPRLIVTLGMALQAVGAAMLILLGTFSGVELLILALVVGGFGYSFINGPNQAAIMNSVDKKYLGLGAGMFGTMRTMGQVLNLAIATIALNLILGTTKIVPAMYPSFIPVAIWVFAVYAIIATVATFLSWGRGKDPWRVQKPSAEAPKPSTEAPKPSTEAPK